MSNIANIQKLKYCDKKSGSSCKCANIATRQVKLKNKFENDSLNSHQEWQYRCEQHANTPTAGKVVFESKPLDQGYSLTKINRFLTSIIGKNIKSIAHTARELRVKYVKPNTGGVMCFQEHSKKWKFVYYQQISEVLSQ
jgi:hypothetical protein